MPFAQKIKYLHGTFSFYMFPLPSYPYFFDLRRMPLLIESTGFYNHAIFLPSTRFLFVVNQVNWSLKYYYNSLRMLFERMMCHCYLFLARAVYDSCQFGLFYCSSPKVFWSLFTGGQNLCIDPNEEFKHHLLLYLYNYAKFPILLLLNTFDCLL